MKIYRCSLELPFWIALFVQWMNIWGGHILHQTIEPSIPLLSTLTWSNYQAKVVPDVTIWDPFEWKDLGLNLHVDPVLCHGNVVPALKQDWPEYCCWYHSLRGEKRNRNSWEAVEQVWNSHSIQRSKQRKAMVVLNHLPLHWKEGTWLCSKAYALHAEGLRFNPLQLHLTGSQAAGAGK